MTIDASDIHSPFEVLDAGKRVSGSHAAGGEASSAEAKAVARPAAGGARTGMDTESRRRIGRNLRILYGDVLDLPLPDRFEILLAELSSKPASRGIS